MQEWISVEDRLPDEDGDCLIWIELDKHGCEVAWFHQLICWFEVTGIDTTGNVTHWMPLPSRPESEVKDE